MAEYIKLDAIMEYCQNQKDKTINCNDLARFPTADVIERSKIDKALEQTYKVREMVLHSNRTYEVNDVLDIIDEISACFERHIGE